MRSQNQKVQQQKHGQLDSFLASHRLQTPTRVSLEKKIEQPNFFIPLSQRFLSDGFLMALRCLPDICKVMKAS